MLDNSTETFYRTPSCGKVITGQLLTDIIIFWFTYLTNKNYLLDSNGSYHIDNIINWIGHISITFIRLISAIIE